MTSHLDQQHDEDGVGKAQEAQTKEDLHEVQVEENDFVKLKSRMKERKKQMTRRRRTKKTKQKQKNEG